MRKQWWIGVIGNGNGNSISFVNFVVMHVGYKIDPMAKNINWYCCGVGFITDTDVLGIWVELVFLALILANGVLILPCVYKHWICYYCWTLICDKGVWAILHDRVSNLLSFILGVDCWLKFSAILATVSYKNCSSSARILRYFYCAHLIGENWFWFVLLCYFH